MGEDLWWEGFVEKVRFEFWVEESGVTVMVMEEVSLGEWNKKSIKENNQYEADGMKHE